MKKALIVLILLFFAAQIVFAQSNDEYLAIKNVIQSAYIDGIHNLGSLEDIEKGFHPDFNLLGLKEDKLTKYAIKDWIESVKKKKESGVKPPLTTCEYVSIDITGTAATAKIRLLRDGKLIFTDYLFLYKFSDGWKIVSKIYFAHK